MPPITGAGCKKAHALDVAKEILGPRWARDHELDKKPVLAEALGDRLRSRRQRRLDPSRGGARSSRGVAAARLRLCRSRRRRRSRPRKSRRRNPASDAADDPEPVEAGEDGESDDIPAFLTGDVPEGVRPNGAAVS